LRNLHSVLKCLFVVSKERVDILFFLDFFLVFFSLFFFLMSRLGSTAVFGAALSGHSLTAAKQMCQYLSKASVLSCEGLFRLSADTEAVDLWASRLDADPRVDLTGIADANVVASLLKRFLRMLNPPLLTYNLYEALIEAAKSEPEEVMLTKLSSCISKLPPLNLDILTAVLQVVLLVLEHQDKNRMGVENLTTVFAPCLIWQNPNDVMRMTDESVVVSQIIQHADKVGFFFCVLFPPLIV
jgi:hypothetical protein